MLRFRPDRAAGITGRDLRISHAHSKVPIVRDQIECPTESRFHKHLHLSLCVLKLREGPIVHLDVRSASPIPKKSIKNITRVVEQKTTF